MSQIVILANRRFDGDFMEESDETDIKDE